MADASLGSPSGDALNVAVNATAGADPVEDLPINVLGLVSIIVFYLIVLAIGVWAGWNQKRKQTQADDQETVMLAGRNIGLLVGVMTMGATWVGGGFINGSAEATYKSGLIWTQAPVGYGLSLFISGTFFAKKMRDSAYVTMVDPFTQKYGKWGALQAIPSAVSEVFWSASILGALGSTLQVILNLDINISIIVSAVIAVMYTLLGGLISVAYTDVFQLFFIAFGLFLALPFALNHEHVASIAPGPGIDSTTTDWIGTVPSHKWGEWIDVAFLLLLGGIPWQCYYQRVLSSKTSKRAVFLSYGGGLIALIMTVPSVLFGAIAKATDWKSVIGHDIDPENTSVVLPLCLQYLTPPVVAFFGLGAISAAVMSSTDSSMLSASTMLARNIYKVVFRPKATEKEVLIALWGFIVFNCTFSTILAIHYKSIYDLFVLCGDFVFVIVFPQLLLVLYFDKSNTYGSVCSFFIGMVLRLACGVEKLGIPVALSFGEIKGDESCIFVPSEDCQGPEDDESCVKVAGEDCVGPVPFRTIVMLISLFCHLGISTLTHYLFVEEKIKTKFDFFKCYKVSPTTGLVEQASSRHLDNAPGTITLDELASNGSFIPRPEYSNGQKH